MPLIKGCSAEVFKKNYDELRKSGKSKDVAYAIAANIAKQNRFKCSLIRRKEINEGKMFG